MKFKEITPGMVIHCPRKQDARALLEHLDSMGYRRRNGDRLTGTSLGQHWRYDEETVYLIEGETVLQDRMKLHPEITEFSDLIESDDSPINSDTDSPMTAKELLAWLRKHNYDKVIEKVLGYGYVENNFYDLTDEEIIQKITAYEAAKKAPKPVELEWVKIFRIIQIQDNGLKKCVYEEEVNPYVAYGTGEEGTYSFDPKYGAETVLKNYTSKHEGRYIAVIEDVCRVKEDKS